MLALLSFRPFRRISYECFLRSHQALALVGVYGIFKHIPDKAILPRLYIYIALGVLGCTSCSSLAVLLFRNGLFSGNGCPRAKITSHKNRTETEKDDSTPKLTPIKVSLYLPRPVTVIAGQYINLWLPSVSMWSWAQTHPFTVTSWSRGKQNILELVVEPRQGLTKSLAHRAHLMGLGGLQCMALYSGPHGITESVDNYESVLCVASGPGIAAVIPYVKKLIHSYNTCTSHVRRVHLVWQVESLHEFWLYWQKIPRTNGIGVAISMQELLNDMLTDDVLDDGYVRLSHPLLIAKNWI